MKMPWSFCTFAKNANYFTHYILKDTFLATRALHQFSMVNAQREIRQALAGTIKVLKGENGTNAIKI
jgi:hypothetical protein